MAVRTGEFDFETTDIADMRTLIVATGREAKSGPIDLTLIGAADRLDSVSENGRLVAVESRLEVILSFLLSLEQREHVLGVLPDPAGTSRHMPVYEMDKGLQAAMHHFGWDPAEPLHGPSSAWVDTDQYGIWKRDAITRVEDSWAYQCHQFRQRASSERKYGC